MALSPNGNAMPIAQIIAATRGVNSNMTAEGRMSALSTHLCVIGVMMSSQGVAKIAKLKRVDVRQDRLMGQESVQGHCQRGFG